MGKNSGIVSIVVLVEAPLNERDYQRLGIKPLIERGFILNVIDVSPYCAPNVYNNYRSEQVSLSPPHKIFNASSAKQVEIFLEGIKEGKLFCMNFLGLEFKHWRIFNFIKRKQIPYAIFKLGAVPYEEKSDFKAVLKNILRPAWFLDRIFKRIFSFRKIDLFVTGGAKALSTPFPIGDHTLKLSSHALDYEKVIENKDKGLSSKHILFIDEYQPFHPDFQRLNVTPPDAAIYFNGLCNYFEFLEEELNLPVVIAAHPRSKYEKENHWFRGRDCIKGKTEELIREAKLVLVNASTATKIAITHDKPVISLTSNELENMFLKNYIHALSNSIGSPLVNVDRPPYSFDPNWLFPDKNRYEAHLRDYILDQNSTGEPIWDAVSRSIINILKTAQSPIK